MFISVDSWLNSTGSACADFGEELSPGFEPIRIRVARQRKPAAAFGNEIGPQANFLVGRSRGCSPRAASWPSLFARVHFSCDAVGRFFGSSLAARGTFSRALVQMAIHWLRVTLDFYFGQFCSFSAQIGGVDDSNPFTAHRAVRKRFLARVQRSDKLQKLPKMKHFVFRWAITTIAVFVAAPIIGISYDRVGCLLAASLLLGLNAFIRPVLL